MITIQVTETELNQIIKALQTRKKKKQKRLEAWVDRKVTGQLVIPVEIADHIIALDQNSVDFITPLIDRLEVAAI